MKLYQKIAYVFYCVIMLLLTIYSFVLIDPNLTIGSPTIEAVREQFLNFGYHQRDLSSYYFLGLLILTVGFHYYFVKHAKKFPLIILLIPLVFLGLFSYSFLSHDLFNYMFDAKILTFYQQNPYLHKALDFPLDPWIRFMQWTHRNYPYGPTFLPLTLVPSFLGFGKFFLTLLLFKGMFVAFYFAATYYLNKMNRAWAVFFATSPLVIFEGLINAHNDLIALSLSIIGVYYLRKSKILPRVFLLLSAGIKYMTFPFLFLVVDKKSIFNKIAFFLFAAILIYLTFWQEIQPWYFLGLFAFLPYYGKFIQRLSIFFAGLIFSYYPYVRFGAWTETSQIVMKHQIILAFFILNLLYLLFFYLPRRKS